MIDSRELEGLEKEGYTEYLATKNMGKAELEVYHSGQIKGFFGTAALTVALVVDGYMGFPVSKNYLKNVALNASFQTGAKEENDK